MYVLHMYCMCVCMYVYMYVCMYVGEVCIFMRISEPAPSIASATPVNPFGMSVLFLQYKCMYMYICMYVCISYLFIRNQLFLVIAIFIIIRTHLVYVSTYVCMYL